ncbi:hypothetical protein [Pseudoalteromonas sp. S16_S37]|uniref:hypothetical protein n=1 Tax=Pseudoalteromonas sp. S16_S37 TaxID=2720228 RepID=UPI0016817406|nr:hypothetical protein [Pseudoalteromonas sp. S16_S37]MBD1582859.1 hypothetical protein [Pseudoalteromonas sp. S16_S37]
MMKIRLVYFILLFISPLYTYAESSEDLSPAEYFASQELLRDKLLMQKQIDEINRHEKFEQEKVTASIEKMRHRTSVFYFQFIQTIFIFFMVMILVLGGFYLAFLQFKLDREIALKSLERTQSSDTSPDSVHTKEEQKQSNSVEISMKGIKLNSSVIGLIILAMSFAFFYLYIKDVYTIELFKEPKMSETSTTNEKNPN